MLSLTGDPRQILTGALRPVGLLFVLHIILSVCADRAPQFSDEALQNAVYKHPELAALILFTMVNNRSGTGAHTSLMINASQRVIFDPAGTLRHVHLLEKEDVIYGITPAVEGFYVRAHASKTHHVVIQKRIVPPRGGRTGPAAGSGTWRGELSRMQPADLAVIDLAARV